MVRSQLACSFSALDVPVPAGLTAFFMTFPMIAKAFAPIPGIRSFTIMKCLLKSQARKSHPPPRAHLPRVPGAFMADLIIVGGPFAWYGVAVAHRLHWRRPARERATGEAG